MYGFKVAAAYRNAIESEVNDAWGTIYDCQRELIEIDTGKYDGFLTKSELANEREKAEREIDICTAQIEALTHALEVASNMLEHR